MKYELTKDNDKATSIPSNTNGIDIEVPQLSKQSKGAKSTIPLTLLGQGITNYGNDLQNNFYYLLENFCSPNEPSNPTIGMLWYDSGLKNLKIFTNKPYPKGPWMNVDLNLPPPSIPSSPKKLTWIKTLQYAENSINDGSVKGYYSVYPINLKFKKPFNAGNVSFTNLNGLKPKFEVSKNAKYANEGLKISFTGKATKHDTSVNVKISFTKDAFEPSETDISMVKDYSKEVTINFLPNITPNILTFNNQWNKSQILILKENTKTYLVFLDIIEGYYFIYDDSTIVNFGTINKLMDKLDYEYISTYEQDNNQYNWIVSNDNTYAVKVIKFSPLSAGSNKSLIIKLFIKDAKLSVADAATSVLPLNDKSQMVSYDEVAYLNYFENPYYNETEYTVEKLDGTDVIKSLSTRSNSDNFNDDYKDMFDSHLMLKALNSYIRISDRGSWCEYDKDINLTGYWGYYGTEIPLLSTMIKYSANYMIITNPKQPIILVWYTVQYNYAVNFYTQFPTLFNKPDIVNVNDRIYKDIAYYYVVKDVQYHGVKDSKDIFTVIVQNNHIKDTKRYQLITLKIPSTISSITDIIMDCKELFTTYKTSPKNIVLNDVKIEENNIYKYFYNVDKDYHGLVFNLPPVIKPINYSPEGELIIKGSGIVGKQLTADVSTIKDLNGLGTFTYSWWIGSTKVSPTTAYTPTNDDVGKSIYVMIEYVDGDGFPEKVISESIVIFQEVITNPSPEIPKPPSVSYTVELYGNNHLYAVARQLPIPSGLVHQQYINGAWVDFTLTGFIKGKAGWMVGPLNGTKIRFILNSNISNELTVPPATVSTTLLGTMTV